MSLRLRLILLIVALVTVVVLVLSGVFRDSLVESLSAGALERSDLASQQVNAIMRKPDYQVVVPLGIAGGQPIFTTEVETSGVLWRNAVLPRLATGAVAATALLASLLLTGLATSRALRPLRRIEQTIDRIAQGNFGVDDPNKAAYRDQPREFAAVQSKLNLLGQQFSGARQDATNLKHSLDEMVERLATQFDVASRFAAISRISGG